MDLAYGFIAQALKTHDDLMAARIQERRRIMDDRRAEDGEPVEMGTTRLRRLGERLHGRSARARHGLRAAAH